MTLGAGGFCTGSKDSRSTAAMIAAVLRSRRTDGPFRDKPPPWNDHNLSSKAQRGTIENVIRLAAYKKRRPA